MSKSLELIERLINTVSYRYSTEENYDYPQYVIGMKRRHRLNLRRIIKEHEIEWPKEGGFGERYNINIVPDKTLIMIPYNSYQMDKYSKYRVGDYYIGFTISDKNNRKYFFNMTNPLRKEYIVTDVTGIISFAVVNCSMIGSAFSSPDFSRKDVGAYCRAVDKVCVSDFKPEDLKYLKYVKNELI